MAYADTSVLLNSLSGKAGSVVFVHGKHGTVVRPRTTPANPQTASQTGVRVALAHASIAFSNLSVSSASQWNAYGAALKTPLAGCNAFTQLGAKLLQINSAAPLPTAPPTTLFFGDTVSITAAGGVGKATFTASAANAASVVTELIVCKLARPNRKPAKSGYRTKAYVGFATGSLSHDVPLAPGTYSCAYRFVQSATGQQVGVVVVGTVTVS